MQRLYHTARSPLVIPITILIFINLEFACFAAWSIYHFGSLSAGLAYLNGDRLMPDAYAKSIGAISKDRDITVYFSLLNASDRPMMIRSASPYGPCSVLGKFPAMIQPSKTLRVPILVHQAQTGRLNGAVTFLTDHHSQPWLTVSVTGSVEETSRVGYLPTSSERSTANSFSYARTCEAWPQKARAKFWISIAGRPKSGHMGPLERPPGIRPASPPCG